jgi:hypothetical protein
MSMSEFIAWVSEQTPPQFEIEKPRRPWAGFSPAERQAIIRELAHHQDAMS